MIWLAFLHSTRFFRNHKITAKEKLEIVKSCGETAPNSGGFSRRNAPCPVVNGVYPVANLFCFGALLLGFGLIQEYCTNLFCIRALSSVG